MLPNRKDQEYADDCVRCLVLYSRIHQCDANVAALICNNICQHKPLWMLAPQSAVATGLTPGERRG